MTDAFGGILEQRDAVLERGNGTRTWLPVHRWHAEPDAADALVLARCAGPTLDVGCGPGRMTEALLLRGVAALGIDTSPSAVRLTEARGGRALLCDVFGPVPGPGRWRHVLLLDGNVGIGGDPAALVRRVRTLLRPGGSTLIEVRRPGSGARSGPARVDGGSWFPWAELDLDTAIIVGLEQGFVLDWAGQHADRWFVELRRAPADRPDERAGPAPCAD